MYRYLQCTMSEIRLLTDGGTPFDAIHKYAPMCNRFTLVIFNKGPSTLETARNEMKIRKKKKEKKVV